MEFQGVKSDEDIYLMPKIIGIIPARAGSESVQNKNIRSFHDKPLIVWTIALAAKSSLKRNKLVLIK